jgi:putative oxidoreductase
MLKALFSPSQDSAFTNLALLVMRLWLGSTMFLNHGFEKLVNFKSIASDFPDPLHIGQSVSLALVMFAEVVGSIMLIVGALTRLGALMLVIDMFVAFLMVHQSNLTGKNSGELAFIYLAGFAGLLIAGPGMISLDMVMFGKSKKG